MNLDQLSPNSMAQAPSMLAKKPMPSSEGDDSTACTTLLSLSSSLSSSAHDSNMRASWEKYQSSEILSGAAEPKAPLQSATHKNGTKKKSSPLGTCEKETLAAARRRPQIRRSPHIPKEWDEDAIFYHFFV